MVKAAAIFASTLINVAGLQLATTTIGFHGLVVTQPIIVSRSGAGAGFSIVNFPNGSPAKLFYVDDPCIAAAGVPPHDNRGRNSNTEQPVEERLARCFPRRIPPRPIPGYVL